MVNIRNKSNTRKSIKGSTESVGEILKIQLNHRILTRCYYF